MKIYHATDYAITRFNRKQIRAFKHSGICTSLLYFFQVGHATSVTRFEKVPRIESIIVARSLFYRRQVNYFKTSLYYPESSSAATFNFAAK